MHSRAVVDAFEPGEFRPHPALSERPLMGRAATVEFGGRDETGANYTSVCSAVSSASSTSTPRYLTVLSSWPLGRVRSTRPTMRQFESTAESSDAVTPRRDLEIETVPAPDVPWRSKPGQCIARLLGDLELHRPLRFLLHDDRAGSDVTSLYHIVHAKPD